MKDAQTLTRHTDIQNWVSSRRGLPAIARVRDNMGTIRSQLRLRFTGDRASADPVPSEDDGMSPCSWSAWLAELDRQQLALRIAGTDCELVDRRPN